MPIGTLGIGAAVTPTFLETYIKHYLQRKPRKDKPTEELSYDEGLHIIRSALRYMSLKTVEDVQAFTTMRVPAPTWVKLEEIELPENLYKRAAELVWNTLGDEGRVQVGGKQWWQWRPQSKKLMAEWIEMRKDRDERLASGDKLGKRILMFIHGGAYYFGSIDQERYQAQRMARKLKARAFAPRYRLAPQFPFPCGLQDCLTSYLYLLESGYHPSNILVGGDSAGGGMSLALLCTIRDCGLPLPAGGILLSPWVDLSHSFPSLCGDGRYDYIPSHGFWHKPSLAWPPPNEDDVKAIETGAMYLKKKPTSMPTKVSKESGESHGERKESKQQEKRDRLRGFSVSDPPQDAAQKSPTGILDKHVQERPSNEPARDFEHLLQIEIDGKMLQVKDQIQLYCPNNLLVHPLVSSVCKPSLGGLPPLFITSGSGELLSDEHIYIAHKAAHPERYKPPPSPYQSQEQIDAEIAKYPPTYVQLQVWDDLCHVPTVLAFTKPAKHQYRSVAQFGAWALARAQATDVTIVEDDTSSESSDSDSPTSSKKKDAQPADSQAPTPQDDGPNEVPAIKVTHTRNRADTTFNGTTATTEPAEGTKVGKAGDPLPPFKDHMIRQRVDFRGRLHHLPDPSHLPALNMKPSEVGVIKEGPIRKWIAAQQEWNKKFASEKLKVQKTRMRELATGFERFEGETPAPTALAGRRVKGSEYRVGDQKGWGLKFWGKMGSKHDAQRIEQEKKADATIDNAPDGSTSAATGEATTGGQTVTVPNSENASTMAMKSPRPRSSSAAYRPSFARSKRSSTTARPSTSRARSRKSTVTDQGQAEEAWASERPLSSPATEKNSLVTGGVATPSVYTQATTKEPPTPSVYTDADEIVQASQETPTPGLPNSPAFFTPMATPMTDTYPGFSRDEEDEEPLEVPEREVKTDHEAVDEAIDGKVPNGTTGEEEKKETNDSSSSSHSEVQSEKTTTAATAANVS